MTELKTTREKKREYDRAWRAANPELARERARIKARARRQRYKEKMRAYDKARYEKRKAHHNAYTKARYAQNINGYRDKAIAAAKARYVSGNMSARMDQALRAAKARAKKRGLPFDLTLEDIGTPTHCAATGIEFDMTRSFNEGNIFVPSLDRIDPALGYVRGNVRVVVHGYNLAKHTGTDGDVVKLARAIVAMADSQV